MEKQEQTYNKPPFAWTADKFFSSQTKNQTITCSASQSVLENEQKRLQEVFQKEKFIQLLLAKQMLKQSVLTLLMIGNAVRTYLVKSDDYLVLDLLDRAINQCKEAVSTSVNKHMDETTYLINIYPNSYQILMDAIMTRFIAILKELTYLLRPRGDEYGSGSSIETFSLSYGWKGWRRIGVTIMFELGCIKNLLLQVDLKNPEQESQNDLKEFANIVEAFNRIVKEIMNAKYPTFDLISDLFDKKDDIYQPDMINHLNIDKSEDDQKKKTWWKTYFGGLGFK